MMDIFEEYPGWALNKLFVDWCMVHTVASKQDVRAILIEILFLL